MDIFGILDPDPHENLCGSETLISTSVVDPDPYWIRIQELPGSGSGSGSTHANTV